jgi:hypothetical protein
MGGDYTWATPSQSRRTGLQEQFIRFADVVQATIIDL